MSNQSNVKKQKKLTINELRSCKGFENYTEEQAEETIKTLEKLAVLFYELFMKQKEAEKSYNGNLPEKINADEGKENGKHQNVA
jgi:hypothetical protein